MRVAQAVDAVALHEAHGAGVVVGPDRLAAISLRRAKKRLGDLVERLVPADRREVARALGADPPQRPRQPVGMMEALGVAPDLGADHAGGIGIALGAAHLAEAAAIARMVDDALDLERADAGTVVWADGDVRVAGHLAPFFRAPGRAGRDPAVCPQSRPIARRELPRRHARPSRWRAWAMAGMAPATPACLLPRRAVSPRPRASP